MRCSTRPALATVPGAVVSTMTLAMRGPADRRTAEVAVPDGGGPIVRDRGRGGSDPEDNRGGDRILGSGFLANRGRWPVDEEHRDGPTGVVGPGARELKWPADPADGRGIVGCPRIGDPG